MPLFGRRLCSYVIGNFSERVAACLVCAWHRLCGKCVQFLRLTSRQRSFYGEQHSNVPEAFFPAWFWH